MIFKELSQWQGACIAEGACMMGGIRGRGGGVCGAGKCLAGETSTAADGTYATGMHSCLKENCIDYRHRVLCLPAGPQER